MEKNAPLHDLYYFAALAEVVTHVKLEALARGIAAKMDENFQMQHPSNLHCSIGNFTASQLEEISASLKPDAPDAMSGGKIQPLPETGQTPVAAGYPLSFRLFRNPETEELLLAICFRHPVLESWQDNAGLKRPPLHVTLGKVMVDAPLTELNAQLREGTGIFAGIPALLEPLQKEHAKAESLRFDRAYIAPAIAKLRQEEVVSRVPVLAEIQNRSR